MSINFCLPSRGCSAEEVDGRSLTLKQATVFLGFISEMSTENLYELPLLSTESIKSMSIKSKSSISSIQRN